jgi:hypothetical protein
MLDATDCGVALMFLQIALGSSLMLLSILLAGVSYWLMEVAVIRWRPWLQQHPHRPKLVVTLSVCAIWIMLQVTVGVWLWTGLFWLLGLFPDLDTRLYFALTAFTTLGFGDVLLPVDWRLLGGMAAANGLLNFGLLTAVLVEAMRQVRLSQLATYKG